MLLCCRSEVKLCPMFVARFLGLRDPAGPAEDQDADVGQALQAMEVEEEEEVREV